MAANQTAIAQRSRRTLHFDHRDMDYYLAWIIGRELYDGSAAEECLAVAARVVDGDAACWRREWRALAEQVDAQARAPRARGDTEGARRAWLRACSYHRAPLFVMPPGDPEFRPTWRTMQACFIEATTLFNPPIERVHVPFQGRQLPGYFWTVAADGRRRPTLLVFGGIETWAEDCYFMVGQSGPRRGYNVLAVDLPGQGMTPDEGLHFGARMEVPVRAVLDYALTRPEIDPERLAIFGFSWGGHIVFKAAQHDRRVQAMIANPAMPNVFRAALAQQQGHDRRDPISRVVFDQIVWRMGLRVSFNPRDIGRRFAKAYDYFFHGKADPRRIACPVLCLAGEGEAPITLRIARECHAQLPHPKKKLRVFTQAEGGEAHCQVDNLALSNGVIFDWLDEMFTSRAV